MAAEILINVRPQETRVAYVEAGVLNDLKIERKTCLKNLKQSSSLILIKVFTQKGLRT